MTTTGVHCLHVGVSPAGVTYNVYPKTGESPEATRARAQRMAERLDTIWERHNNEVVRVRKTTETQVDLALSLVTVEMAERLLRDEGRSFFDARREDLLDLLAFLPSDEAMEEEFHVSIHSDCAWSEAQAEVQTEFGVRQQIKAVRRLARRVRAALGRTREQLEAQAGYAQRAGVSSTGCRSS